MGKVKFNSRSLRTLPILSSRFATEIKAICKENSTDKLFEVTDNQFNRIKQLYCQELPGFKEPRVKEFTRASVINFLALVKDLSIHEINPWTFSSFFVLAYTVYNNQDPVAQEVKNNLCENVVPSIKDLRYTINKLICAQNDEYADELNEKRESLTYSEIKYIRKTLQSGILVQREVSAILKHAVSFLAFEVTEEMILDMRLNFKKFKIIDYASRINALPTNIQNSQPRCDVPFDLSKTEEISFTSDHQESRGTLNAKYKQLEENKELSENKKVDKELHVPEKLDEVIKVKTVEDKELHVPEKLDEVVKVKTVEDKELTTVETTLSVMQITTKKGRPSKSRRGRKPLYSIGQKVLVNFLDFPLWPGHIESRTNNKYQIKLYESEEHKIYDLEAKYLKPYKLEALEECETTEINDQDLANWKKAIEASKV